MSSLNCVKLLKDQRRSTWSSEKTVYLFSDLGLLLIWVLREYEEADPVILSVGDEDEVSIKEAVDVIAVALGFKGKIHAVGYNNRRPWCMTAMNMTCDWFVANYDNARR